MGFYVGFDGNITYPENINLQVIVEQTPLDRLLVETDSPYLAPVPLRGSRNEPFLLTNIVTKIATDSQEKIRGDSANYISECN